MNKVTKSALGALFVGSTLMGGAFVGSALTGTASAASDTSSTAVVQSAPTDGQSNRPQFDPSKGGHTANGITETLLTGDVADKVKAAALAKYPGATIQRVETDAEGAAYEAHLTTSDGKFVTITFDTSYNVVSDQAGPGGRGGQPPMGAAPSGAAPTSAGA